MTMPYGQSVPATSNTQQKPFLASLFDFGFTSFITLRFLKVIYGIAVVVVLLLAGLGFFLSGLASGKAPIIVLAIIFVPLVTLLYLILTRLYCETIAMFFRMGDNTALMVQLLAQGRPTTGYREQQMNINPPPGGQNFPPRPPSGGPGFPPQQPPPGGPGFPPQQPPSGGPGLPDQS